MSGTKALPAGRLDYGVTLRSHHKMTLRLDKQWVLPQSSLFQVKPLHLTISIHSCLPAHCYLHCINIDIKIGCAKISYIEQILVG